MSVQEMIRKHPQAAGDQDALTRCIEECFTCAVTCTSCADACLGEETVKELVRCIRLNLDCAEICATTGGVLARQSAFEPQLARHIVEVCGEACRICAAECDRHAGHHDHCRISAESCRRCEQACSDVLTAIA